MPKLPPTVVALLSAVALLGPALSALSGHVPPNWLSVGSALVALAGFLHNWLLASSVADSRKLARVSAHVAAMPRNAVDRAALAKTIGLPLACLLCLAAAVSGCSWLKSDAAAIEAAIVAGLPIACDVVAVADPAVATLVCELLDDSGNIITQLPIVSGPAADIRAIKHPTLAQARAALAARKLAR